MLRDFEHPPEMMKLISQEKWWEKVSSEEMAAISILQSYKRHARYMKMLLEPYKAKPPFLQETG